MVLVHLVLAFMAIVFCTLSFGNQAVAVTDRCPRHQVKTELVAKQAKTRFMTGSIRSIGDYTNTHGSIAFVQDPLSVKTFYKFSTKEIGNGNYCVMLDKVKAQYRSSPRIVMPTDIKKNSCKYKIIRKHEQRHLDVHYNYHKQSTGQYQAFLGRIARNVPKSTPVRNAEEAAQMQQHIINYFDRQFYTRVQTSIGEMHKLQSRIDSSQEYVFTGRKIDRCESLEARGKKQNKKSFYDK